MCFREFKALSPNSPTQKSVLTLPSLLSKIRAKVGSKSEGKTHLSLSIHLSHNTLINSQTLTSNQTAQTTTNPH